uniref:Cilia- and flagella-associated protein 410 n=1 Tax=Ciona savignyi TaxID=51511 RepID=H2YHK2_CIOSA
MVKLTEKLVLARARASDLDSVKTLNCWGSGLTDVSLLQELSSLEVINFSANEIEKLEDFENSDSLRELYLRKNNIQDVDELTHLQGLKDLKLLWLSGNPFCENLSNEDYRLAVIKRVPQVQKLDNISVSMEELQQALASNLEETSQEQELEADASDNNEQSNTSTPPLDVVKSESKIEEEETPATDHKPNCDVIIENNNDANAQLAETKETGDAKHVPHVQSAVELSLEETNQLRIQLGLKPMSVEKFGSSLSPPLKPPRRHKHMKPGKKNILNATLALVEELGEEELIELQDAVHDRLSRVSEEEKRRETNPSKLSTIYDDSTDRELPVKGKGELMKQQIQKIVDIG